MPESKEANERSSSNTIVHKRVIVRGTPAGRPTRPAKQGRFAGLSQRNPRDRLTVTIAYKGGNEGWWVIEARGKVGAFPSSMALIDVMGEINRTPEWYGR